MATSSEEQYLKTIYSLSSRSFQSLVPMKEIAELMSVSPGTVTSMAKNLRRQRLIEYVPQRGCRLTESGKMVAIKLLRRHRLIEEFLFKILGYSRAKVHEEAEILEHAVSDYFIEQLDALLNFPAEDPHGDPIPTKSGEIVQHDSIALHTVEKKDNYVVQRLVHIDPSTMVYLEDKQLVPGSLIEIIEIDKIARIVKLRMVQTNASASLSFDVAANILVTPETS